jgi:hypothetical protein
MCGDVKQCVGATEHTRERAASAQVTKASRTTQRCVLQANAAWMWNLRMEIAPRKSTPKANFWRAAAMRGAGAGQCRHGGGGGGGGGGRGKEVARAVYIGYIYILKPTIDLGVQPPHFAAQRTTAHLSGKKLFVCHNCILSA